MPRVRVKINRANIRKQILLSGGASGMCKNIAYSMANRAGPGYAVHARKSKNRARWEVYPATSAAQADNYLNNTLEKVRGQSYDD